MYAAHNNHIVAIKSLMVGIDIKDYDGNTALMHAAKQGHLEIVRVLIEFNVYINAKNVQGDTTLIMAAENSMAEIMKEIINASGFDEEYSNKDNIDNINSALEAAVLNGKSETVKALLQAFVEPKFSIDFQSAYRYNWDDVIGQLLIGYEIIHEDLKIFEKLISERITYFSSIPRDLVGLIKAELKTDTSN